MYSAHARQTEGLGKYWGELTQMAASEPHIVQGGVVLVSETKSTTLLSAPLKGHSAHPIA